MAVTSTAATAGVVLVMLMLVLLRLVCSSMCVLVLVVLLTTVTVVAMTAAACCASAACTVLLFVCSRWLCAGVLQDDQSLLWLQAENVLHCSRCTLHAALLKPLSQCEQHHQRARLKPVTQADGTEERDHHLRSNTNT